MTTTATTAAMPMTTAEVRCMRSLSACMSDARRPITVNDFEPLARERVERGAWDYQAGGAGDEITLGENRAAWDAIRLRPRVMVDVSTRDLSTSAFGGALAHPIVVAPMAAHQLSHPDAERASARGTAAAGGLFTLSTVSSVPMEEVAAAAPGAQRWFQLYAPADRDACRGLVERAAAAGFSAIAPNPAATARSTSEPQASRSVGAYSWNQRGAPGAAAATSSIGTAEMVERA